MILNVHDKESLYSFDDCAHAYQASLATYSFSLQDENLKEVHNMIEMDDEGCEARLKTLFEQVQHGKWCKFYHTDE